MARCREMNPFIVQLLPIAMSHDPIFQSLLAFSGIHYHYSRGTPVDETTLIHYGQAVKAQKFGITFLLAGGKADTIVPLLITSLILCIVEVGSHSRSLGSKTWGCSRPMA
jgi:hypothetical protein